jgi:hypothetical protein
VQKLKEVHDKVVRDRRLLTFIEGHVKHEVDLLLDLVQRGSEKRQRRDGRRQLLVSAALGAVLGILVNWVSDPLWGVVRHLMR